MGTLDELVAKDAAYRAKVAACAHDWTRVGEHSCECPRECTRCDISELWWLREQVETLAARERDHMNAMASLTAKALEAVAVWQQRTAEAYERAPREYDEQCHECGGTGIVHKRERFALQTPNEHMKGLAKHGPPSIDPKHNGASTVPANALICSVCPGSSIWDACREGVALARAADRPVAFEFNETVAICQTDSNPDQVASTWWDLSQGSRR